MLVPRIGILSGTLELRRTVWPLEAGIVILCLARLAQQTALRASAFKVPRGSGCDISQECAFKRFERTSARLPVCQNRNVPWTELPWYNWVRRSPDGKSTMGCLEQPAIPRIPNLAQLFEEEMALSCCANAPKDWHFWAELLKEGQRRSWVACRRCAPGGQKLVPRCPAPLKNQPDLTPGSQLPGIEAAE